eukprot:6177974-Pleurochrysis_carterae.AAC.1
MEDIEYWIYRPSNANRAISNKIKRLILGQPAEITGRTNKVAYPYNQMRDRSSTPFARSTSNRNNLRKPLKVVPNASRCTSGVCDNTKHAFAILPMSGTRP